MRRVQVVRVAGLSVIAAAAVFVWFTFGPEPVGGAGDLAALNVKADTFGLLVDAALEDYEANDERADTAPKQQVVNGWVARDLLMVTARLNTDQLTAELFGLEVAQREDERPPALLLLLVLAVALNGATAAAARSTP